MTLPVTVIIVNYNAGNHLAACLTALREQTAPHMVVVVDNASKDESILCVRDMHPDARVMALRRNVGFARAVNLGALRHGDTSGLIVTINPDVVPRPDFVERLIRPFQSDESLGAVAGTLTFATAPEVIASAGIVVHRNGVALDARLGETLVEAEGGEVFGASGGAAAYRMSAFVDAGWLPDVFFLYLEDVDLAWRLRLRGWRARWEPAAVGTHEYSSSAVEGSPFKRRLLARNRLWTLARCLPTALWNRDWFQILGLDLAAAGYAAVQGDIASLRGRAEGTMGLPARLHERRTIQARARVSGDQLAEWVRPPVPARELLRLRRLTAKLASGSRTSPQGE